MMGQNKLVITVDETEYARLREKADAQQREPGAVVGELITQWLAEQPPHAPEAPPEAFEPFEAWQREHDDEFKRLLALPIEERRDLARRAGGKLKLPVGMTAAQYVHELRTGWAARLARPEQGKFPPTRTDE
jgi:hypothetical protein